MSNRFDEFPFDKATEAKRYGLVYNVDSNEFLLSEYLSSLSIPVYEEFNIAGFKARKYVEEEKNIEIDDNIKRFVNRIKKYYIDMSYNDVMFEIKNMLGYGVGELAKSMRGDHPVWNFRSELSITNDFALLFKLSSLITINCDKYFMITYTNGTMSDIKKEYRKYDVSKARFNVQRLDNKQILQYLFYLFTDEIKSIEYLLEQNVSLYTITKYEDIRENYVPAFISNIVSNYSFATIDKPNLDNLKNLFY